MMRLSGLANKENHTLAAPNTPFFIASITKLYTATIIMQLYEEKKLKLSDTMENYLEEEQVKGHIRKLVVNRLENLNEEDIIRYFGEPEFKFKITINELIRKIKPKFETPNINTALHWLNKKQYNKSLLKKYFPNISDIPDGIINPEDQDNCLLCVSLTPDFKGYHYKIIATVIEC